MNTRFSRTIRALLAAFALTVMLSGCIYGPAYTTRPGVVYGAVGAPVYTDNAYNGWYGYVSPWWGIGIYPYYGYGGYAWYGHDHRRRDHDGWHGGHDGGHGGWHGGHSGPHGHR